MSGQPVNIQNFRRAETDRMFTSFVAAAGGAVNDWMHVRTPTPLDQQPVIRMNRDTLYSIAVVNLAEGATVTIPDAGDRYISVMIVNNDHYINQVLHAAGDHALNLADHGTDFVAVGARILVDPNVEADVAAVNALQDQLQVRSGSARPFTPPEYDAASLDATRSALLELARGVSGFAGAFGARDTVDPVMHLLGTAAGWGGLPDSEAMYVNVDPHLPSGRYTLTVKDVPVDGFWSISMYNHEGYFPITDEPVSVNDITAARDDDGSVTVHFGDWDEGVPNRLPTPDGWNYLVRLYRPRPEVRDGSWAFPAVVPA